MDSILLSDSSRTRDGLALLLEAAIGAHDLVHMFVDAPTALYIVEIAKRAPDYEEWFPRGKWATIQSIQAALLKAFDELKFAAAKDAAS